MYIFNKQEKMVTDEEIKATLWLLSDGLKN